MPMAESADMLLGDRELRRGMRINIAAGAMGMFWVATALGIPLTMFMEALGASGVLIGFTATVQQLAMVLQIPSALVAERLPRRKLFWAVLALAHRVLWFVPAFLPFLLSGQEARMARVTVLVVAVSSMLANGGAAAWWSWMADLIPERLRGSFWGRRQSLVTFSHLGAVWLAGWLLDLLQHPGRAGGHYTGFVVVFFLGAVMGCADIITHMWVPEPRPGRPGESTHWFAVLLHPLRERDFLRATLAIGVWTFGLGMIGQFTILYLRREFAVSYTHLSAIAIAASLGVALVGMLWGYVMDRLGARNLGATAMVIAPLLSVVWFFMRDGTATLALPVIGLTLTMPQPILLLLATNLLAGAFYSAVGLAQVGLMAGLAPATGRTVAMAVHWSVVGLMAALGPVAGGAITDLLQAHPLHWTLPSGLNVGFVHVLLCAHMAITWGVALPLLLSVRRRAGEVEFRTAFSRLMIGNPLRAVSSVYNICAMNVALSSRRRADALRKIGSPQAAVAVNDLISGLEDPACEVREEAVMALGRTGTPEAIDALLRKLNDPHTDVCPQIIRALRSVRDPVVTEAIMSRLGDSDRETAAEAARALGEIGDNRASRALLELMQDGRDDKVFAAAAQALARLGEMAAMYVMVPRMSVTPNPVLKRSLAVAVGDLLGEPGAFYGSYIREQRNRGAELARLVQDVAAQVRAGTAGGAAAAKSEGRKLLATIDELEHAYERGELRRCIDGLHALALGLATLHFGTDCTHRAGVSETLVWHNERFGVGMWFINLIRARAREAESNVDDTDILLAAHFLANWASRPG